MSDSYQEIEVKLYVPDLSRVQARLRELGATEAKPRLFERNVRYENADHTFTENDIVLRLREDDATRLTYKAKLDPEASARGVHSRFEAEVTVSDFEAMNTILERLGFHAYMVYEKYRTTYELDEAEIMLDEMPYGDFVEIEGDETAINLLLKKLNLKDVPRIPYSYGELFDNVRHHMKLDFTDLTFENFQNIDVSPQAFEKKG